MERRLSFGERNGKQSGNKTGMGSVSGMTKILELFMTYQKTLLSSEHFVIQNINFAANGKGMCYVSTV